MFIYCKDGSNEINCFESEQIGYGLRMPSMPNSANLICEDIDGVNGKWIDNTATIAQALANNTAIAYLAETDWYVTRFVETGIAVPAEITAARASARSSVV